MRVLAMGDSITSGPSDGGWRGRLGAIASTDNVPITWVGGPGDYAPHEGHPGWDSIDLLIRTARFVTAHNPQCILLLIGTNDAARSGPTDGYLSILGRIAGILDTVKQLSSSIGVVVSTITRTTEAWNSRVLEVNSGLPSVCAAQGARVVDGYSAVELNLSDGVHPDAVGYERLGEVFYAGLLREGVSLCAG